MQSGKAFILCLGVSFHVAASQQLSEGGCACKSACDKSWMHSGGPWCYVDSKCKDSGWDHCQDTQMLYASAVKEKTGVQQALQEAQKAKADLQRQLAEANSRQQDIEHQVGSLKQQLAAATDKAQQIERKSDTQVKDLTQKLSWALKAHTSKAAAVATTNAQVQKLQEDLAAAENRAVEATHKAGTIDVMQKKVMQAEKMLQQSKAENQETREKLSEALKKQTGTQEKLSEALQKQTDTQSELQEAKQEAKDTAAQDKEDLRVMEERLSIQAKDSERKLTDTESLLMDTEAVNTKLKQQLAEAHQKQAETDKALKAMEQGKRDVEKQLSEELKTHGETKEKLRAQVQETHAAKLDVKLYDIFRAANDKTAARARLRATGIGAKGRSAIYMKK